MDHIFNGSNVTRHGFYLCIDTLSIKLLQNKSNPARNNQVSQTLDTKKCQKA